MFGVAGVLCRPSCVLSSQFVIVRFTFCIVQSVGMWRPVDWYIFIAFGGACCCHLQGRLKVEAAKEKKILINMMTYPRRLQTASKTLRKFEENTIFVIIGTS